ncbi:hypothetical protein PMAYCL1PPCAC_11143, partial [Pristionchus mayeri]
LQVLLSLLLSLPIILALDCHCSTCGEGKLCAGDYCYEKTIVREWTTDVTVKTGCITPREDPWKSEVLPLCEKNHRNITLCLCNNADKCNTVDMFADIHSNEDYVRHELIDCVNLK